jgi:hypothetical protein
MKAKPLYFSLALAFLAGFNQTARATVAFTITPSSVSNTYSGKITLQVTGLTNGDTVLVQKYLDINTNGIIDAADFLVQQFDVTDGHAGMVIGGVTNLNVPGDTNTSAGTITTTLNFQDGDFTQNITGKYLYKLSSPAGHFTAITNGFSVTSFSFAQKFTGNVVSNRTSTVIPHAVVILFPPPRSGDHGPGNPVAAAVADTAGAYTVLAPPGTYSFIAVRTNYVYDYSATPILTLGAGATVTTNLTLTSATASITGKFVDAATNSIGLPGIFVPGSSTNGQIAACFTDTSGNFSMRVTSGQWQLGSDDSGLIVHGYLGLNNKTNVNSGATNVIIPFPKATALFYGTVKDSLGNPMANIDVNANDQNMTNNNLYQSDGYTDANGKYYVGIVGGLGANDTWGVQVSNGGGSSNPTNYLFSQPQFQQNGGTNVSAGTAVLQDFTGVLTTNLITGNVQQSNGNPIGGVGVFGYATINSVNYQTQVDTDGSGNYALNVANGNWNVNVNCNGGNDSLDGILGPGNYLCPNNQNVNISNNNGVANFVVQPCSGIQITRPSPLPAGEVNAFYDQFLQASSCNGNFNWTQIGGTLPSGVGLSGNGELSGVPGNSGVFTFTAQVMDGNGLTTNQQFSLSISNALQITTTSLPNGGNGAFYSQQLQASGGITPDGWSLSPGSSNLPPNLSLSGSGLLSGTAAATGTFNFSVRVTDNLSVTVDQPLTLNLVATNIPPLSVATAGGQIMVFWPGSAGTNFNLQMTTNLTTGPWVPATNGVPQVSFAFTNMGSTVFFRLQ